MTKFKQLSDRCREQGEADRKAGKPIGAFYDMPLQRHTELLRGSYEIGWRDASREQWNAGRAARQAARDVCRCPEPRRFYFDGPVRCTKCGRPPEASKGY